MPKMKLRPTRKGLKVPFSMSQKYLKEEGESVKMSSYWIRRMKEGDVEEVKEEEKPKAVSKKKTRSTTKKVEAES